MNDPKAVYSAKTEQYNVDFEAYNAFGKTFGHFADDGKKYVVTDRNTPRQWLNFMVNDAFGSVAGNDGSGYVFFKTANLAVTKYYSATDYLVRTLNGRRSILLKNKETGAVCDLFADSRDMVFTAEAGRVTYAGTAGEVSFSVCIFVPESDPAEIWEISLKGAGRYEIAVGQDVSAGETAKNPPPAAREKEGVLFSPVHAVVFGAAHDILSFFYTEGGVCSAELYEETYANGRTFAYVKERIAREIALSGRETTLYVLSGAVDADKEEQAFAVVGKYRSPAAVKAAKEAVLRRREEIFRRVKCDVPDKNLQYFLNVWLKNQLFLTMRYNRCDIMGYRDVMQDSWGNLLVEPEESRAPFLEAISKMFADGRCPRQYDRYSDKIDARDFMDSPLWAAIALTGYIKETGDFSLAEEEVGFLGSEEKSSVKDHLLRAFDYLYRARGKNGLLLMRDGDWLDGLTGISAYGEATTVWGTIAAFYAQNLLADLLERTGDGDAAALLRERSAEYKKVVNAVGWDGNWYAYAFIGEEPVGSHRCHEGKIYLNAQTWAALSGIADTPDKIEKAMRAVHTYLSGMYGPHLLMPPYTKFGEKCGRLQKHRPGTFSNGAIYLHGAAFKFAADCARGDYAEALDTVQRILPNHEDSCDSRRTSEPYCVGNVYFGVSHPCYGLNLYTWFTATPAWLIHTGFESFLGVKADYEGLRAELHGVLEWKEYTVDKLFRGRRYRIRFSRAEAGREKGLYIGGKKLEGDLIPAPKDGETAAAEVYF